jgi:two-component system chemotaxis response regulator CheB
MKMPCKLVVIGGSAGSLDIILNALNVLNPALPLPIVIVLHRKNDAESMLAEVMAARTRLVVKEAEEKEEIMAGTVYVAPADYHLLIEKNNTFSLDDSEKVNFSRPSIDPTFETAAEVYGHALACILLSGASADGCNGLMTVKHKGGITAAQDPATAIVPYMPIQAIERVGVDRILKPGEIGSFINSLCEGR